MGEEVKQVLQDVYNHQMDGIVYHSSLVDMYDFLHLKGMRKWQKNQLKHEMKCAQKIQHHFIKHHHMLLKPYVTEKPKSAIPDSWYSVDSMDLSASDIIKEAKKSLGYLIEWEEGTCEFLRKQAMILMEHDAFDEYLLVKEMMSHVAAEKHYIESLMMELESVNYDPVYLRRVQERLCIEFDK